MYDIAVIGSGPAGLSAAINAKIRNKNVIIFGQAELSAKLLKAPKINNYLGFPNISGKKLAEKFSKHLQSMGIEITQAQVKEIYPTGKDFGLYVGEEIITAKKVIIAIGVNFGAPILGEKELLGDGVGYCATCDAPLYKGKDIIIVGQGAFAEEEVKFCTEICGSVKYLPTYKLAEDFSIPDAEIIQDIPKEITKAGEKRTLICKKESYVADGIFILKQNAPPEQLCKGLALTGNHVQVDGNMETNIKGLFACGDITGLPYQYAKAIGQGQIAALYACND